MNLSIEDLAIPDASAAEPSTAEPSTDEPSEAEPASADPDRARSTARPTVDPAAADTPVDAAPTRAELRIAWLALRLGARRVGGPLSAAETRLADAAAGGGRIRRREVAAARDCLLAGGDPFADAFERARSRAHRRRLGAVYTPPELVEPIVRWILDRQPVRVVDAGCGSGRFSLAVSRASSTVEIVAVDVDPLATLMTRAALAVVRPARCRVINGDYRTIALRGRDGRTAFLGNPPYVRHHDLAPETKAWMRETAARLGFDVSGPGRAGLHALFFLATAAHARRGDVGCFVTSSEWLDTNYGAIVRQLLLGPLGGEAVLTVAPESQPFAGIDTTAAVACFEVGARPAGIRFGRPFVGSAAARPARPASAFDGGTLVARDLLARSGRWSAFVAELRAPEPRGVVARQPHAERRDGYVELGELCRVHRGAATGANAVWVGPADTFDLPARFLLPAITHARELFAIGERLESTDGLQVLVELPPDLDCLDASDRARVDRFLAHAQACGADRTFIAENRKPWWRVRVREPAPILATYMARRPPTFVRNVAGARNLNIAHGIYPRIELLPAALDALADALRSTVSLAGGRTYAGGLTKFEPREMERLLVPEPARLEAWPR